jgi:hypothetical protein
MMDELVEAIVTRGSNTKFRREVFDAHKRVDDRGVHLLCGVCGVRIDPVRDRWDADHEHAKGAGGTDHVSNGRPLCVLCHRGKTALEDAPKVAKVKRTADKHFGIRKKAGWYKPPGFKHQWGRRDD